MRKNGSVIVPAPYIFPSVASAFASTFSLIASISFSPIPRHPRTSNVRNTSFV